MTPNETPAAVRDEYGDLEALARAATPGPWVLGGVVGQCHIAHRHGGDRCKYDYRLMPPDDAEDGYGRRSVASMTAMREVIAENHEYHDASPEDAAFIAAAHPERVLALVAELRSLRERLAAVRDAAPCADDPCGKPWDDAMHFDAPTFDPELFGVHAYVAPAWLRTALGDEHG